MVRRGCLIFALNPLQKGSFADFSLEVRLEIWKCPLTSLRNTQIASYTASCHILEHDAFAQ